MSNDPSLQSLEAAKQAVRPVITAAAPHLDRPSPCDAWTAGQVLNHLVGGQHMFAAVVEGTAPLEPSADHLGDDPVAAFDSSLAALQSAFAAPGVLERTFQVPVGELPGSMLVGLRIGELLVHGWDIARATGQATDFGGDQADAMMPFVKELLSLGPLPGVGFPFASPQSVPPTASRLDVLAALTGRAL